MRTGCTGNARGMHIKCARSLSPGLLERSPPRVLVVFVAALLEDLEHVEDVVLLPGQGSELRVQLGGLEPPLLVRGIPANSLDIAISESRSAST